MLPYLIFFLALAWAGSVKTSQSLSRLSVAFFSFLLLLFMGTRYWVGCDYYGYLMRFNNIDYSGEFNSYLIMEEPGFHLLNFLIHSSGLGYSWLILLSSLIIILCMARFSFFYRRPLMVLALFFPVLIVQLGMSGLRQAIAVSFLMVSLIYFCRGRRISTAAFILLASTFHQSAALFLPIAFLAGKTIRPKKLLIIFLLASPLVAFLLGDRLAVYQDRYVDQIYGEVSSGGALIRFILLLIPCLMFFMKRRRLNELYPEQFSMMYLFMIITVALIPLGILSTVALHRMIYYVMPVSILVFLHTAPLTFSRNLGVFAPAIVYGIYLTGWFSTSYHAQTCYVPYQTEVFQKSDDSF